MDPIAVSEPRTIEITVHRCVDVSRGLAFEFMKKKREYYIEVTLAGKKKQTKSQRKSNQQLEWNEKFTFDNVQTSSVTLSLYYRRIWRHPKLVQQLTCPLASVDADVKPLNTPSTASFTSGSHIEFSIKSHNIIEQAKEVLGLLAQSTPKDCWKRLLEGIETFRDTAGSIADVHPYAKLAHALLFAIPAPLIGQLELDGEVKTLFDSFACFCDIANDLKGSNLNESGSLGDVLKRISLQMTEIAYFVRDYCREGSFLKRALRNKFSGVEDAIQEYYIKIGALKDEFRNRLVLQTGVGVADTKIKVIRVFKELEAVGQSIDLNDIPYVQGAGLNTDNICLEGTREKFLEEIGGWVNSDGPRTLLISGGAGTGKSAIAQTIAARFRELGRLGSVFCFSEDEKATRKPTSLFPHIARDLADLDPHIRTELAEAVRDKVDRTTSGITAQFEKMILIPANAIRDCLHGPIVIVIDALDELGPTRERGILLKVLAERLKELPPNFRFVITSRPDPDIEDAFKHGFDILIKRMQAIPSEYTTADIAMYVRTQLVNKEGIDDDKCCQLASHAHGLFQWASVACQYICQTNLGETFMGRYEELMQPLIHDAGDELVGDDLLDCLYRAVLSKVMPRGKSRKAAMINFRFVMTRVLTALEPLSSRSLNKLVTVSKVAPKNCNVEIVVKYLGSLLSGVDDPDTPIRPLHASFRNFLANSARSKDFFVGLDTPDVHLDMAMASFRIMDSELTFNICRLETSYLPNKKIPGIEELIKKYIPRHLSYACRFWAAHLLSLRTIYPTQSAIKSSATASHWSDIMKEVDGLLSNRLLYCLEVLSIECAIGPGLEQIRGIHIWFKEIVDDANIILLVEDVQQFFSHFVKCIATSVPHIYISALPFAPKESLVAKHYIRYCNRTMALVSGQLRTYPRPNVLHGHTSVVRSVTFSPDGTRIVSSSDDNTIRIWNVENGEILLGPLQGHAGWVNSVGFSPDGTRIVSGSGDSTVRVWNAESGEMVLGPLQGHTDWVNSVSFSPDGTRIISGSDDNTIRVWNAKSGEMVVQPLQGHTDWVHSVSFSPDGTRVVSGSRDNTIRVWSVESGEMVLGPLQGHTDAVNSVSFSSDGICIVSGSSDKTVRIWDAKSGGMVIGPLQGHMGPVYSTRFSPDNTHIVSGSGDKTTRVWNTKTGEMVIGPYQGHTNSVFSAAFSPDSTHIVSGSGDNTIQVWNPASGGTGIGPLQGHTGAAISVDFSPDGTRVASGSDDNTIRIWNAESGEIVTGPLRGHTNEVNSVKFSPDGSHIVSGSGDNTIRIWNAQSGEIATEPFLGHTDAVNSVGFSPDGTRIVSGSDDNTIRVWNAKSGEMVMGPLQGHTDWVNSVSFSPDGTRIVSGSGDNTIRVWNVESGEMVLGPLQGHTDAVISVEFSPEGIRIISGSKDKTIRVWDAVSGEMVLGLLQGHTNWVFSAGFSPDGTYIVSGSFDNTIRVWNAESGEMAIEPLLGHTSAVSSVGFSPDGTRIVSSSYDKTVRVQRMPRPDDLSIIPLKHIVPPRISHATHPNVENPLQLASSPDDCDHIQQIVPHHYWNMEDGWSLGINGELLFYLPPAHRANLHHPNTICIISTEIPTRLDTSRFVHGTRWPECFNGSVANDDHN